MRFGFLLAIWTVVLGSGAASAGDCTVRLGPNLSVVSSEHSDRLYLTIGDSGPIYFSKPEDPPRVVVQGLDMRERYSVKVYFDNQVVQSWNLDFKALGSKEALVWRAKGGWRMEAGNGEDCVRPPR